MAPITMQETTTEGVTPLLGTHPSGARSGSTHGIPLVHEGCLVITKTTVVSARRRIGEGKLPLPTQKAGLLASKLIHGDRSDTDVAVT